MHSQLRFSIGHRAGQSVLRDCFYTPPLKLLTLNPHQSLWPKAMHAMQMSASPGLLAGDVQEMEITLESGAALYLSTQAYQRVLSMNDGGVAQQSFVVRIADDARLCYMPHALVLHNGAHLRQNTHIVMGDNAELIWSEIIASGRKLNGEHFAFERLSSHTRIEVQGKPRLLDNLQWQPKQQNVHSIGQMEGFSHQANLYYVNTGVCDLASKLEKLQLVLDAYEPIKSHLVLAGASIAALGALQVRALGLSAEVLEDLLKLLSLEIF
jgi:urease accessory protein